MAAGVVLRAARAGAGGAGRRAVLQRTAHVLGGRCCGGRQHGLPIALPPFKRWASSGGEGSERGHGGEGGAGARSQFGKYRLAGVLACGAGGTALWLSLQGHKQVAYADYVPRRFLTTVDFSTPTVPVPSKIYPYVIISHPRAIVAQAALETLTHCDPDSEVLVVADRYNFDDQQGSRLYAGAFGQKRKGSGSAPDTSQGRQMITAFTTGQGKAADGVTGGLPLTPQIADKENVHVCTTAHVTKLDVENKIVTLSDGRVIGFGKVLLATGCREARLPGVPTELKDSVTNLRKVKDFDRVQGLARSGKAKRIVVVGGGFLGCEVASQLAAAGKSQGVEVVHLYVEPGALYRYVPVYFADYVTERLRQLGVVEKPYHMVLQIRAAAADAQATQKVQLVLQGFEQTTLDCSHVVFAPTHLEGNVELAQVVVFYYIRPKMHQLVLSLCDSLKLAQESGLEIDAKCGGVMVNSEMMARTGDEMGCGVGMR